MSGHPHSHHARDAQEPVPVHVITVSDSRTPDTDTSGALMHQLFTAAGCAATGPTIIPDDVTAIQAAVLSALRSGARVVALNGGTGITARDVTPEAVTPLLDKHLPGFGELFRFLSVQEVGTAGMLSRAMAGARGRCLLVCLPGSTAAVRMGMEKVLLPELRHILAMLDT